MFNEIQHKIATLGFIGFLPHAPGTFGTAVCFLFMLVLQPDDMVLILILVPLFFVGVYASGISEKLLGKDSGHIVIDEFYGYLVSVLFIPKSAGYLIAAFILFRIFDIFKPPPIREMEETFSGGFGIMIDDVLAGVYTNLCLQFIRYLM
jgi:phosphatidylglycerophosphatase A